MTRIERSTIAALLSPWTAALIDLIATAANRDGLSCYVVGGVVRDLLLGIGTVDIDIVVEGDAIGFAARLAEQHGGPLTRHEPFGTAIWTVYQVEFPFGPFERPEKLYNLDFAMSRAESYPYPGSLPVVSPAALTEDLVRRDFTLNALALRISPDFGEVIDLHGGLADLAAGRLRVLHERSFLDDPTRILRGARFAARFGFAFDDQAIRLARASLDVFDALSAHRVTHDLSNILAQPRFAEALHLLDELGVLTAIHPALRLTDRTITRLTAVQDGDPLPHALRSTLTSDRVWLVWMSELTDDAAHSIAQRLNLSQALQQFERSALRRIESGLADFTTGRLPLSWLVRELDKAPLNTAAVVWLLHESAVVRSAVEEFFDHWSSFFPIRGDDLKARGLRPGPCFQKIIQGIRAAWIDGQISSDAEADALIGQWVADGLCAE